MKNQELNELYAKLLEGPTIEVEAEFAAGLWNYCRKLVKKRFPGQFSRYKDCVNDAVFETLRDRSQYDGKNMASFSTWVGKVTLNVCYRAQHTIMKRNEYPLFEDFDYKLESSKEEKQTLKQLLLQLPQDEQDFVNLKLQGFENKEVAEHFGKSESWAKTQYFRITESLKLLASKKP